MPKWTQQQGQGNPEAEVGAAGICRSAHGYQVLSRKLPDFSAPEGRLSKTLQSYHWGPEVDYSAASWRSTLSQVLLRSFLSEYQPIKRKSSRSGKRKRSPEVLGSKDETKPLKRSLKGEKTGKGAWIIQAMAGFSHRSAQGCLRLRDNPYGINLQPPKQLCKVLCLIHSIHRRFII